WLIYRRWRALFGGRVVGISVGAAALLPKLGRLFSAAGLEIREGYGLTETSPVIAFNRFEPGGVRFGTVGIPVPGVEVKIKKLDEEKEEGEVLVKGPNVMLGYFQQDELTHLVIDEAGWLHTGDIGEFVHKRFLQITDRKKAIFKTSKGKYVAPQPIENKLRSLLYIEDCVIVGFNRPFVTALIYPAYGPLKKWCIAHNVHWTSPQFMVLNPKVKQLMEEMIQKVNVQLSGNEQIKGFHLLYEAWSVETGELTPTLKPKRPFIEEKYQQAIDEMYA
ncbi:MAG: AMP-binding protein, partial [Bacteroidota bacterium]